MNVPIYYLTSVYKLINFFTKRFPFPKKGRKYVQRWMQKRHLDKKAYSKKLNDGIMINVIPQDHIQQQLFWYGEYEKPVAALLRRLVKKDSFVLDLGANIGYFTLIAAKRATQGTVIAFEPANAIFSQLSENIQANNLQNTILVNAAASEFEGKGTLYLASEDNCGMSALRIPENYSGKEQSILLVQIDKWINQNNINKLDIVKMDVEGSELSVLKGMTTTLSAMKPILIIEVNPTTLAIFGFVPDDLVNFLTARDYFPYSITPEGFVKRNIESTFSREENFAFIHADKINLYETILIK